MSHSHTGSLRQQPQDVPSSRPPPSRFLCQPLTRGLQLPPRLPGNARRRPSGMWPGSRASCGPGSEAAETSFGFTWGLAAMGTEANPEGGTCRQREGAARGPGQRGKAPAGKAGRSPAWRERVPEDPGRCGVTAAPTPAPPHPLAHSGAKFNAFPGGVPACRAGGHPFCPVGCTGGSAEPTREGTSHLTGECRVGGVSLPIRGTYRRACHLLQGQASGRGSQASHHSPGTKAQTPEPTSPQDSFLPVAVRAELGLGGSQGSLVHPP